MKQTQIYLNDEDRRNLEHLAAVLGQSKSAIVRQLILDKYTELKLQEQTNDRHQTKPRDQSAL